MDFEKIEAGIFKMIVMKDLENEIVKLSSGFVSEIWIAFSAILYAYLKQYDFKLRAIYDQSTFGNTNYISRVNALFLLQK